MRAYWSLLINRNALPMRAGLTSRKPQHNAQCSREHHAAITLANNPQWYLLYLRDPMTQLPTRLRVAQSRETPIPPSTPPSNGSPMEKHMP